MYQKINDVIYVQSKDDEKYLQFQRDPLSTVYTTWTLKQAWCYNVFYDTFI